MVDLVTAEWLKSDGARQISSNGAAAPWGALAVESSIRCPFDTAPAASAEGARQLAFLGMARVVEQLRVPGRRIDLMHQPVTITADAEGYRSSAVVFVIGAAELDGEDATQLKVVRRLA